MIARFSPLPHLKGDQALAADPRAHAALSASAGTGKIDRYHWTWVMIRVSEEATRQGKNARMGRHRHAAPQGALLNPSQGAGR